MRLHSMKKASTSPETAAAATSIDGLQLKFPRQKTPLFDGLSLTIREGEKVLLLGPSGSGKSTLLKVLTGLIPEVIEMAVKWQHRKCFNSWGYVFQDPDAQFCMPYVDEEIAFVLENLGVDRQEMPERITRYLRLAGLEFEDFHQPVSTLSRGQKQRVALASALALKPDALVLDEPTALLDPEGTQSIWKHVRRISRDKTLLVVEHKIDKVVDFVDRVVVLDENGKLIIDCPATRIQKHRSLLDQYGIWHAQSWEAYDKKHAPSLPVSEINRREKQPVLEVDRLTGSYDKINRITLPKLQLHAGEWVTITGPNGAGKSTLLLALMQLIPTEGHCRIHGEEIRSTGQIASDIGFVFQNPELHFVARSVRKEIVFTLDKPFSEIKEHKVQGRVTDVLKQYGLLELAEQNPYQLSTGQQRRLSIAATTVKKRDVLLLDEPTFGQDAANTFAILNQLEALRRKGTAILMVTHSPEIVQRFATRKWQVAEGALSNDMPGERITKSGFGETFYAI